MCFRINCRDIGRSATLQRPSVGLGSRRCRGVEGRGTDPRSRSVQSPFCTPRLYSVIVPYAPVIYSGTDLGPQITISVGAQRNERLSERDRLSITKIQKFHFSLSEKGSVSTCKILATAPISLCKGFHVSMFFGSDAPIRTLTHEWAMHTPPRSPGGHASACTPAHAHDFLTPVGMPRSHAEKGFRVCRALP